MADLHTLASSLPSRPWWRWMAGMMTTVGRVRGAGDGIPLVKNGEVWAVEDGEPPTARWYEPRRDATPDLTDPATLGCLHALVEELAGGPVEVLVSATGDHVARLARLDTASPSVRDARGPTRAHALAALGDALADGGAS